MKVKQYVGRIDVKKETKDVFDKLKYLMNVDRDQKFTADTMMEEMMQVFINETDHLNDKVKQAYFNDFLLTSEN